MAESVYTHQEEVIMCNNNELCELCDNKASFKMKAETWHGYCKYHYIRMVGKLEKAMASAPNKTLTEKHYENQLSGGVS